LGYGAAGVLGIGLRRDAPLLPFTMPLLVTLVATGITVRAGSGYVIAGIALTLLLSVIGGFTSRERIWKREGVDHADGLQWDVAGAAAILLLVVTTISLVTPAAQWNPLTTWVWQQIQLPQGLARLDQLLEDGGATRVQLGTPGPGEQLELGRSLEVGNREDVALMVRAAQLPSGIVPYWRGRVFDRYTGQGWTTGPLRLIPAEPLVATAPFTDLVRQEITDLHADRKVRYGVPDIVAIDQAALQEQSAGGNSLGWIGVAPAQTYTVFSYPPRSESGSVSDPRVLLDTQDTDLVVPDSVPTRVITLTKQITNGASSQTERARAIERYLRELPYSYEVAPLPPGGDAVDQFLFTMRQGYCTYYASAMAMMARVAAIPSRVAVGYATGSYDANSGTFVVREGDAHAWPELYIDGQGWTRWEPTPIRPLLNVDVAPEQPRAPVVETTPLTPAVGTTTGWWLGLGIAALTVFAICLWAARRAFPLTPARVHHELYRYGRRAGVLPAPNVSVQGYADRLAHTAPAACTLLAHVAALLTAHLYRKVPLSPSEERDLIDSWQIARGMLRRTLGKQG
jgi:transglutaminase-like putative cysteine protease